MAVVIKAIEEAAAWLPPLPRRQACRRGAKSGSRPLAQTFPGGQPDRNLQPGFCARLPRVALPLGEQWLERCRLHHLHQQIDCVLRLLWIIPSDRAEHVCRQYGEIGRMFLGEFGQASSWRRAECQAFCRPP